MIYRSKLNVFMKLFKYILFLLLIAFIGISIYIAVQPNSFEVSRTRTINAPAAVIYNNVIDFKNWQAWSSWAESDPEMKIYLSEQTKGINGSYSWDDKDGVGMMKTIQTVPDTSIEQEIQISEFPPSTINWTFNPNNNGSTDVTWDIKGTNLPFMFKMFSVFRGGMDKQIGPHYERSLEKLDSIVVTDMNKYSINIDGITEHSGGFYIYNSASSKITNLSEKIKELMTRLNAYAVANSLAINSPFILYHQWDDANNAVMFSYCIPTSTRVITTENDILTGQLNPFKALKTTLKGNYNHLQEAWKLAMTYIPDHQLQFAEKGPMMESYVNDPLKTPNPADLITEIFIAIKE